WAMSRSRTRISRLHHVSFGDDAVARHEARLGDHLRRYLAAEATAARRSAAQQRFHFPHRGFDCSAIGVDVGGVEAHVLRIGGPVCRAGMEGVHADQVDAQATAQAVLFANPRHDDLARQARTILGPGPRVAYPAFPLIAAVEADRDL